MFDIPQFDEVHTLTAQTNLETLLDQIGNKPVVLVRLACLLLAKGEGERARELCARAVALAPRNGEVHAIAAEVLSHEVPNWYFVMVRDRARHMAYESAFRRIIRRESRVLDIGAGTGLFAMMAARAGAAEVITCEARPAVAAAVSDILAENGLANRVRVIAKHSSDLEIGVDLDGPADVIVWDNTSNNMIGAGALPTVEQAVRWLARSGAPIIPARGIIRVALAEDREAHRRQMQIVEGFDLSAFNRLATPSYAISVGSARLALRSKPADLFRFDFQRGGPFPEARASVSLCSEGGPVNGIAQWVRFETDEEGWYENIPCPETISAFDALFYPLSWPIEMTAGDTTTVCGSHDRQALCIWGEVSKVQ
jgi:protein-L-isoaspartate O-methyltransferase